MAETPREPLGEYEREPVPEAARLGLWSFVGQYAAEHVAGTELMIGPLFIAAGVGAFDLLAGLVAGNLLAVLCWTFLTAPIATRARLTLYYQLEKICGRRLVTLYDLANGAMFTLLAGAMITVATTALGVWLAFPMPGLTDYAPRGAGWVLAVLGMGALFSVVAACGYRSVARFANVAAPWIILMFLAFGIMGLKALGVASVRDFWPLAETVISKGGEPLAGRVKFTFWHVCFFAWFCNVAWHMGMADLSILRYARRSWHGLASGAGMFVGHFLAWLAASILYALQIHENPANTDVLPGPLAYRVCGVAGLICVIMAGWTTANPTLYRAGLAFQAVLPRLSRFRVTLGVGLAATLTAIFPAVTMRLLEFVALWGMILMPMGAVIFVDFWCFKRLGLTPFHAEASGASFNPAAAIAWLATLATCTYLVLKGDVQIYFVSLPGWLMAAVLYLTLSFVFQRRLPPGRSVAQFISALAAGAAVVSVGMHFAGMLTLGALQVWLLAAAGVWFVTAPFAMERNP